MKKPFVLLGAVIAATQFYGNSAAKAADSVLHVYNWSDFFAEKTLEKFTKETGIAVKYDTYDSDEVLMTKMLAGNSGYDVVFPGTAFAAVMQKAGVFQKLDPAIVENTKLIDKAIVAKLMPSDPDMTYFVPYATVITGFAYNSAEVEKRLPGTKPDDWAFIFNANNIAKLKDCGIGVIDAPNDLFQIALRYNNLPIDSVDQNDLKKAHETLRVLREGVKYFNSGRIINDLANGEICVAVTWTGDGLIAAARAKETGNRHIDVVVPKEGSVFQADVMAIPADAPNARDANIFMNFLQRPDIHAEIIASVNYGTANTEAAKLLSPEIRQAPGISPSLSQIVTLWPAVNPDAKTRRLITRMWTHIKAGK